MASKKRKAKKTTSRRRKVGAMKVSKQMETAVKFGSLIAGFAFADKINPQIDKLTGGKLDDKIIAAGGALGGGYYLFMHKGKKNILLTGISGVLAGASIKRGMQSFGIGTALLSGYGKVPVIGRRVAGYHSVPVIGQRSVNGGYDVPGQVGAYRVNPKPFSAPVMSGVESGSGITNTGGGSLMS